MMTRIAATLLFSVMFAPAQVVERWVHRYAPETFGEHPSAVSVDPTGNVIVAGWTSGPDGPSDYYTAKYSAADGTVIWEKKYNGPGHGIDEAAAVAVDKSGRVSATILP